MLQVWRDNAHEVLKRGKTMTNKKTLGVIEISARAQAVQWDSTCKTIAGENPKRWATNHPAIFEVERKK